MSSRKHLLVEGKTDQRLFKLLLCELANGVDHIVIESADLITNSQPMGNREKVEAICRGLEESTHAKKIIGFVDREFRGFNFEGSVNDTIGTHFMEGRIVWSRGHSIENYLFCIEVLRQPLRSLTNSVHFETALKMFESSLLSILRIASAVSLAARDNNHISFNALSNSITTEAFSYSGFVLEIEGEKWASTLKNKLKMDEGRIADILASYNLWIRRLGDADEATCQWVCHGHTGMSIIFAAYAFFVQKACIMNGEFDHEREARCIQNADHDLRNRICGERLANLISTDHVIENPFAPIRESGIFDS